MTSEFITSLALTFALHSTILLGSAWLLFKAWRGASDSIREYVWRGALLAAVLGPILQVSLQTNPAAGHVLTLPTAQAQATNATPIMLAPVLSSIGAQEPALLPASNEPLATASSPTAIVAVVVALLALLALGLHVRARHRLLRTIKDRRLVHDSAIHAIVQRHATRAGYNRNVRVSQCDQLDTAVALGIVRPEICLPTRCQRDLDGPMLEAMIAHELAHLIRRDPVWIALMGWLTTLFFWQPLVRVARSNLIEIAELRADQIAAELAGRVPLARCLVEVASWLTARRLTGAAAFCGMAVRQSVLAERVDRLLEYRRAPREMGWVAGTGAFVVLAAGVAFGLPGVNYGATDLPRSTSATLLETFEQLDRECDALESELLRLRHELAHSQPDAATARTLARIEQQTKRVNRNRSRIRVAIQSR